MITDPPRTSPSQAEVVTSAGRGMAWSLANSIMSRLGTFVAGIILARFFLAPEDYGVFAAAAVVLTVLLGFNELGVSVAIVQRPGPVEDIAGTVLSLTVLASTVLAGMGWLAAPTLAAALDAPAATGIMRVLVVAVAVDGLASMPNAVLTRLFLQRTRLCIDAVAFVVGTGLTLLLAIQGAGAWSLAWGALAGNVVGACLAIIVAPVRYRPRWRTDVVRELLRFGLPLAGSSLLLILLLNVDYMVVSRVLGARELGLYLLAFNLCSWPISVFTSALRRVALAFFARHESSVAARGAVLGRVLGLVLAVTLPMCLGLALLGESLVVGLYGQRWAPAAAALPFLAIFTLMRIVAELLYDYFAAGARTRSALALYAGWLVLLVPSLVLGTTQGGIRGTAFAHALVALLVVVPLGGVLLVRCGVRVAPIARACGRPLAGALAMAVTVVALRSPAEHALGSPLLVALCVGAAGLIAHLLVVRPLLVHAHSRLTET